jgi:hypothetical protein
VDLYVLYVVLFILIVGTLNMIVLGQIRWLVASRACQI